MQILRNVSHYCMATLALAAIATGCDKKTDRNEALPADARPVITRITPNQASNLASPGDATELQFVMADNERLVYWELRRRRVAQDSLWETVAADSLTGTQANRSFTYTIPASGFADGNSDILFWAYVWDNLGQVDSNRFLLQVNVVPSDTCIPPYRMLSYGTNKIFSRLAFADSSSFNLLQRRTTTTDPASDIRETSSSAGTFRAEFRSPNTHPELVFVVLNAGTFNYDLATWCSIDQAFRTHTPGLVTGTLQPGDVVLLNMALPPDPGTPTMQHYAAIQIVEVVDNPGDANDYIIFRYKRTENN